MEIRGGRGRRLSSREASPERARLGCSQQQRFIRCLRKVQVIYYLSRNGQLEQPHFIELPHLPNHQLRLRDVMERLTLLRGKGMPSLFSWSCKRSYKNGYVWNDLAENDIIFPAEGVEYVLKGSEIIPGAYARFQHVTASTRQPKRLPAPPRLLLEPEDDDEEEAAEEEVSEEEELRGGKGTGGDKYPNGAGYSRLSQGVSTDEIERVAAPANHHGLTELPTDDSSPPSSTTSDKPPTHAPGLGASRRFEEVDQTPEPGLTRNSVLLQLIACGSAALKGRSSPSGGMIKAAATSASPVEERRSNGRHRGVVSRLASRAGEEDELRRHSDNPRFCHPLIEDKEYFSGSIFEGSMGPSEPSLKKSSSYNEERSSKLGIGKGKLEMRDDRGGDVKVRLYFTVQLWITAIARIGSIPKDIFLWNLCWILFSSSVSLS
ncbi:protein SOSEKI 2-like isoform X3 [Musa acuminata AAA Group]|uniref:protein SOSEKI 2-like isoform X3 n=1 Tax=Musa acuminata AAA Group TaxID=214697 RepID=UPI0031CECB8F